MGGGIINPVIWHPPRVFVQLMAGQRDVLDELVGIPAECFARCISVVHPDFVGLREIDRFARISSKPCDRMDHFARAQVDNFNRPLVLSGNEQALPFEVYCHVVEIAFDIRQWNALDLFQRRISLALRSRSQNYAQSPEYRQVRFHSLAPHLAFSQSSLPPLERPQTYVQRTSCAINSVEAPPEV